MYKMAQESVIPDREILTRNHEVYVMYNIVCASRRLANSQNYTDPIIEYTVNTHTHHFAHKDYTSEITKTPRSSVIEVHMSRSCSTLSKNETILLKIGYTIHNLGLLDIFLSKVSVRKSVIY